MSSCCGGNCGCGANCKCGNGCTGCGMYPDLSFSETTPTNAPVFGFAPQKEQIEGFEMAAGAENGGCNCKCGSNCQCKDPCPCEMEKEEDSYY